MDVHICIIGRNKEIWLEEGEEKQEFKQDLGEEVVALEWWDLDNPTNEFIGYEEVRPIEGNDFWYEEDDLWA